MRTDYLINKIISDVALLTIEYDYKMYKKNQVNPNKRR